MPVDRRPRMRPEVWAWAGACGVLAVLLIAFAWLPGPLADLRAYRAAPECGVGRSAQDCRTVRAVTVTGVEGYGRGRGKDRLTLRPSGGSETLLTMAGMSGVPGMAGGSEAAAREGKAELVLWRGEPVEVRQGPYRDLVANSRPLDWRPPLIFGALLAPPSLGALLAAGWLYRRQRRQGRPVEGREAAMTCGVLLAASLLAAVGGLVCVLAAHGPEGALRAQPWVFLGVAVVAAPFAVWASLHRPRARRETPVRPRTPVGERVIAGRVSGEVPYSKEGFDRLVVGPGLLAATPDPTGRIARVRVPALEVVRVRESWPDESVTEGRSRTLTRVVECRDGDREVLVAVAAEDVPEVLGALGARPAD